MHGSNLLFPKDIYEKHLGCIKGVNFTPREIDVISCLLNRRGTSKIASLLIISPNTVLAHTRNVMVKLGCNSREGIIDFIERGQSLLWMRKYYARLVIHAEFKKSLKNISKLKGRTHPVCLILYADNQAYKDVLIPHLENHLKQAGIDAEIRPEEAKNKIEEKKESHVLSLILEKSDYEKIPKDFLGFGVVDIFGQANYYFLVFEILKKAIPEVNLETIIEKFREEYEGMECSSEDAHSHIHKDDRVGKNEIISTPKGVHILINKKWYAVSTAFCVGLFCLILQIINGNKEMQVIQGLKELKASTIRSDLPVPIDSVLLYRTDEMAQIDDNFKEERGIQTIALVGPGGAGKTILARQYAHKQKAKVIWEINAETHETLKSSFEDLAEALAQTEKDQKILIGFQDIKNPTEREKKLIEFVKKRLRAHLDWFFIFDNVEGFQDIQKYFPQDMETWGQGKIILTTRNGNIQNNKYVHHVIQIGELSSNEKLHLFTKIMTGGNPQLFNSAQVEETKQFLKHIPSYPLDISIAAYYLRTTNISYAAYLESLKKNDKGFTNVQEELLQEAGDYTKTRYGMITLSLQHLIDSHKDFGDLLLFISLLDSQNIPRDLLDFYKNDVNLVDSFMLNLKKYSLITNSPSSSLGSTFSMHRSTQEISLVYLTKMLNSGKNKQLFQLISKTLEKYITHQIEREDLPKLRLLLNHCEMFLSHPNLLTEAERRSITSELGGIYLYLGNYEKAKQLLEGNLSKSNKSYHKTLSNARALAYLGNVYGDLGNYEKARNLLERCVNIYKQGFPENHAGIARALTYLGNVHRDLGNYEKAKDLLEQSYSIYKQHLPAHYSGNAWASTCLGIVNTILGNYKEASSLLEQSLSIYKKHLSKNNIGVAWVLAHLGDVHGQLGNYEKAKALFEQSIGLYKEYFPEDHIKTGWALSALGEVYRSLREYEKAKSVLEQSLQIYKKHLSENNIVEAGILVYLGAVYKDLGDYEKAKNLLEKSLGIYKKHFPEDHNEIAWALAHLGDIHRAMGRHEEAKLLLDKSILIYKKHFSENHPEVKWALECLRNVYHEMGNHEKAKALGK